MKNWIRLSIFTTFLLSTQTNAQTIFEDNFGNSTTRIKSDYTPFTYYNSFRFADPNLVPNIGTESDPLDTAHRNYAFTINSIENNFYAVVNPANAYDNLDWSLSNNGIYKSFESLTSDYDNTGAAMLVNAGITLNSFYKRKVTLEVGKTYEASFYIKVINGESQVRIGVINSTGQNLLAQYDSDSFSTATTNWVYVSRYFKVPDDETNLDYYISFINNKSASNGNDFAVDNMKLRAITDVPAGSTVNEIAPNTEISPVAVNDTFGPYTTGSSVTFNVAQNVFSNDLLTDQINHPVYVPSWETNTTNKGVFSFIPPNNGTLSDNVITVPNEGTWKLNIYTSDGDITFTPVSGFTGNPTPISYNFVDVTTGYTSNYAKLIITYEGVPIANDDIYNLNQSSEYNVSILDNDSDSDTNLVSVTLYPPYYGGYTDENGDIVVDGEGIWHYSNGLLTFTPVEGFTNQPSPIYYNITKDGKTSGKATVTINITQNASTLKSCIPVNPTLRTSF